MSLLSLNMYYSAGEHINIFILGSDDIRLILHVRRTHCSNQILQISPSAAATSPVL